MENKNKQNDVALEDKVQEVEKLVSKDLSAIRVLTSLGLISREQGQNLMKQVISNAYGDTNNEQHDSKEKVIPPTEQDAMAELIQSGFFNKSGREDLLSYLKNSKVTFDKDELSKISQLVEILENEAINRYQKQLEYGKALNDENQIAKQRLTANAQNPNVADNIRTFTRDEIGKMSTSDFARFEAQIMDQLRKGLIK